MRYSYLWLILVFLFLFPVRSEAQNFEIRVDGKRLKFAPPRNHFDPEKTPVAELSFRSFKAVTPKASLEVVDQNSLFHFDIYAKRDAVAFVSDAVSGQVFDLESSSYDLLKQFELIDIQNFYLSDTYSFFQFMAKDGEIIKENQELRFKNVDVSCEKKGQGVNALKKGCQDSLKVVPLRGTDRGELVFKKIKDGNETFAEVFFKEVKLFQKGFEAILEYISFEFKNATKIFRMELTDLNFSCERNRYVSDFIFKQFFDFCSRTSSGYLSTAEINLPEENVIKVEDVEFKTHQGSFEAGINGKFLLKNNKIQVNSNLLKLFCLKDKNFNNISWRSYIETCFERSSITPKDSETREVRIVQQLNSGKKVQVIADLEGMRVMDGRVKGEAPRVETKIDSFVIKSKNAKLDCKSTPFREGFNPKLLIQNCKNNLKLDTKLSVITSTKDPDHVVKIGENQITTDRKWLKVKLNDLKMSFSDDQKTIGKMDIKCAWNKERDLFKKVEIMNACLQNGVYKIDSLKSIEEEFSEKETKKRKQFFSGWLGSREKIKLKELFKNVVLVTKGNEFSLRMKARFANGLRSFSMSGEIEFLEEEKAILIDIEKMKAFGFWDVTNVDKAMNTILDKAPMLEVVDYKERKLKVKFL